MHFTAVSCACVTVNYKPVDRCVPTGRNLSLRVAREDDKLCRLNASPSWLRRTRRSVVEAAEMRYCCASIYAQVWFVGGWVHDSRTASTELCDPLCVIHNRPSACGELILYYFSEASVGTSRPKDCYIYIKPYVLREPACYIKTVQHKTRGGREIDIR